ncbi:hypothetical protein [Nitratireductor sp. XY-223]|uniref:hypothetical protein n=1 Tax=Nitratireductor sp. XY-223 TaxID=2561926 RepID=UPI001FEE021A|nr:hypothetical protein [Nitratireductor sp. XY-223]
MTETLDRVLGPQGDGRKLGRSLKTGRIRIAEPPVYETPSGISLRAPLDVPPVPPTEDDLEEGKAYRQSVEQAAGTVTVPYARRMHVAA